MTDRRKDVNLADNRADPQRPTGRDWWTVADVSPDAEHLSEGRAAPETSVQRITKMSLPG